MQIASITSAQRSAAEIEQIAGQTATFLAAQLSRIHAIATADPVGVLSAIGTNAASAISAYHALHSALSAVLPGHAVPSFVGERFQINSDGSVTYIPATQEPNPEPSPQPSPEDFEPLA
jgi:hypothetical protein